MLFINTRPSDRASSLTQALTEAGYQVESLPLLELVAEPFSEGMLQLYQQLEQVQVIVVVSPTAVEIGMRYLQQAGITLERLAHIQWIAVGKTTAQALAKFNIKSDAPEIENSEGMLQLPILRQHPHLSRIAFWRGQGGRQFMMQQLQQQGISILNFVLYHRQCPEISVRRFPDILPEIQPYQPTMVLISSEASWNYWQQLCGQNPVQAQWVYLVLGERVVKILENTATRTGKAFNIIPLENLSASGMIQRINDWQGNL